MNIHVHHHVTDDDKIYKILDEILTILKDVQRKEVAMGKELDALTAQVTANENLEQSAITLIQGLAAQITAAGTDPVALQNLTTSLQASAANLAAAIAANTPAAPAAPAS